MSATCQCGAPLTGIVEQWTGECEGCCPPSLEMRFRSDLRSTAHIATASVHGRARLAARDAAREAAHGYSVKDELSQVGPEPSDACPKCGGDGWRPDDLGGHFWVECDCQAVSS